MQLVFRYHQPKGSRKTAVKPRSAAWSFLDTLCWAHSRWFFLDNARLWGWERRSYQALQN